jgi:putative membrane protein
MKQPSTSLRDDSGNFVRGILMGGADVIPGVSGGTVALIVGIYERLVTAISHFDVKLVTLVRQRQWGRVAGHVDLRFLVALALGIGTAIVALGGLMNELLAGEATRPPTLAAFFGMIVASTLIVARRIDVKSLDQWFGVVVLVASGAAFAWWITTLGERAVEPSLPYLFLCGMIGICAMILPGISGAYILLILGTYAHMTHILKALPKGQVDAANLAEVAVFAAGCAIGLLSFSKILRWLLAHQHWQTMAVLCGFMIGALRKIWPFQNDLTPNKTELKHKVYENMFPESFDGRVATVIVIAVVSMAAVFLLDWLGRSTRDASDKSPGGDVD